jgi:hypothetical protein
MRREKINKRKIKKEERENIRERYKQTSEVHK